MIRTTSIATLAYASLLLLTAVISGEVDGPTPPFTSLEPVRAIDLLHVPAYGLLAWLVPGGGLLVAGLWVGVRLRRLHHGHAGRPTPDVGEASPVIDPAAQARIDRELSQL